MEKIGPANNFVDAYNALDINRKLDDKRLYDAYYVRRDDSPIESLKTRILMDRTPSKILYTGHRKSGKTTELYRLIFELQDRYFILYYSVLQELETSDVEYMDLLLLIALKLCDEAIERGVSIDTDLMKEIDDWLTQTSTQVIRIRVEEKTKGKSLGAKLRFFIGEIGAGIKTDTKTRLEIREKLGPRISEIIKNINIIVETIQQELGKEPIVIVDDLDKIDTELAENIFFGHSMSLTSPNCKIIFTIPVSLIYLPKFKQIEAHFPQHVIIPLIETKNKDGKDNKEGLDLLRKIILRRMSENLFEKEAFEHLLRVSNGVLSDFLSVAQMCCVRAESSKSDKIVWDMVDEGYESITNSFRRMIKEKYYGKLSETYKNKTTKNDQEMRDLLDMLAVIDYGGGYYDVHPAIIPLLKEKKLV